MKSSRAQGNERFGTAEVWRLLLRLAPPVMFAQLIQALYNIVDSYFIGRYSGDGLSALSVIFPVQLLVQALAVGTGVGVNTVMSGQYGQGDEAAARQTAGAGTVLSAASWAVFALLSCGIMGVFTKSTLQSPDAQIYARVYGRIVCGFSLGIFAEGTWSKVLQANGDMKTPMFAQVAGAAANILLDWLLIFGKGIFPEMGVAGAAVATVAGQFAAAAVVGVKACTRIPNLSVIKKYAAEIYRAGVPAILMNALCTVYIVALNYILVRFSDDAVTVLGLYYKLQTFCLIPVLGLTTCIVPVLSYNYAARQQARCREILWKSVGVAAVCMGIGTVLFEAVPRQLISVFSKSESVLNIGTTALRIIGASFVPIALSLVIPTYFQAIGRRVQSIVLVVLRQICLLVPLAWAFSHAGLNCVWLAFPVTEFLTAAAGVMLYVKAGEREAEGKI